MAPHQDELAYFMRLKNKDKTFCALCFRPFGADLRRTKSHVFPKSVLEASLRNKDGFYQDLGRVHEGNNGRVSVNNMIAENISLCKATKPGTVDCEVIALQPSEVALQNMFKSFKDAKGGQFTFENGKFFARGVCSVAYRFVTDKLCDRDLLWDPRVTRLLSGCRSFVLGDGTAPQNSAVAYTYDRDNIPVVFATGASTAAPSLRTVKTSEDLFRADAHNAGGYVYVGSLDQGHVYFLVTFWGVHFVVAFPKAVDILHRFSGDATWVRVYDKTTIFPPLKERRLHPFVNGLFIRQVIPMVAFVRQSVPSLPNVEILQMDGMPGVPRVGLPKGVTWEGGRPSGPSTPFDILEHEQCEYVVYDSLQRPLASAPIGHYWICRYTSPHNPDRTFAIISHDSENGKVNMGLRLVDGVLQLYTTLPERNTNTFLKFLPYWRDCRSRYGTLTERVIFHSRN